MKRLAFFFIPFLAVALGCSPRGAKLPDAAKLEPQAPLFGASQDWGSSQAYAKGSQVFAATTLSGDSADEIRVSALKGAAAKAAELLAQKGLGDKATLTKAIEGAVIRRESLGKLPIAGVQTEYLREEKWARDKGQDAWSVSLILSVTLK